MEQIEKLLGKKIIRIETNDLDDMEEVRCLLGIVVCLANEGARTENEEGSEVVGRPLFWLFWLLFRQFLSYHHTSFFCYPDSPSDVEGCPSH